MVAHSFPSPHRLTFIHVHELCDICDTNIHTHYSFAYRTDRFYGWLVCDNCTENDNLTNVRNFWVKPLEELEHIFGTSIKISRSSGKIDDGWIFYTDAVWNYEHREFITYIRKNDLQKSVRLSTIIDLN